MIVAVPGASGLYTHPHRHPSDDRKMTTFAESVTGRTSHNRVVAVIWHGGSLECRPSGVETRTRKATDVYDEIVSTLSKQGRGTDIRQHEVEDLLILKLGATQRTTLNRHQEIMVRLGYLRFTRGATAFTSAVYDLVGRKVAEIKAAQTGEERAGGKKLVKKRR